MIFTNYSTAADFSYDTMNLLKEYEIQNNLLIKNIGDGPDKTMLSVKDDNGDVILTAIRTRPFPMVMFETKNIRNDGAIEFFVKSLAENGLTADHIMAEKNLADSFVRYYEVLMKKKFQCTESLTLYVVDKASDLPQTSGHFRTATEKDMYFLPYWCADFTPACHLGSFDLNSGIQKARNMIEHGNLYIWEDGYPVSMAASVREVTDCKFIGQVYTPVNFRGRGYSTACVSSLTRKLLKDGYRYCALYADCLNQYSNAVYKKIGYKEYCMCDTYKIL